LKQAQRLELLGALHEMQQAKDRVTELQQQKQS
jgi:hypothetical protein